ncbi:hypothetical protein [Providencia stuartii]|uniref:hypothetical protein n=1 Tax=Providencia stuartii TaxID=588 RepID=UPI000D003824|nr:hypothetical protein [Providencia stuartii]AVL39264.1 hypothetical protein CEP70_04235 [Providencia stuartii]AVL40805.1 hypothetical protein CEP70_12770 [Providencia stuartii]
MEKIASITSISNLYSGFVDYKPTAQVHTDNGLFITVDLGIDNETIRNMTISEIEKLALKLASEN